MRNLQRLAVDAATMFVLDDAARIVHENEPGAPPGPRLCLLGCGEGNLVRLRHDVGEADAERILRVIEAEPPWSDPAVPPACLPRLVELLGVEEPAGQVTTSTVYALPQDLPVPPGLRFVRGGTDEGEAWAARAARRGMPANMVAAGFVDTGELWAPWVLLLEGEAVASVAFAARAGAEGLEAGVYTFEGFRGRGLAAAVTAAWSGLPEIDGRALFYSTSPTNRSSHRVAARLGLAVLGAGLRIA